MVSWLRLEILQQHGFTDLLVRVLLIRHGQVSDYLTTASVLDRQGRPANRLFLRALRPKIGILVCPGESIVSEVE